MEMNLKVTYLHEDQYDVLCVGDMLYDAEIGGSVLNLCNLFIKNNKKVFIGNMYSDLHFSRFLIIFLLSIFSLIIKLI